MEVEVRLNQLQQGRLAGHEFDAAAQLIQELVKFCLYEQALTPSPYDNLKAAWQQSASEEQLGKTRRSASTRRATKFVTGIEKAFEAITGSNIASLNSGTAAIVFGPSLARPSVVYRINYSAISDGCCAEPAQNLATGANKAEVSIDGSSLHAQRSSQTESQLEHVSEPLGNDLAADAVRKTVDSIAKKMVRAIVIKSSAEDFASKIQGGKKLHILLQGSCIPDPPAGLLPKRNVTLAYKKVHIVDILLSGGCALDTNAMQVDCEASGDNKQIWCIKGIYGDHEIKRT